MHIVCEGPDRVGKDSQIKKIQSYFKHSKYFHILKYNDIKGLTSIEAKVYNKSYYSQMFSIMNKLSKMFLSTICNRAHLGEYVYSPLYRGYNGDFVFDIEKEVKEQTPLFWNEIYLITLIDKPENLIAREDGESLSGLNLKNKINEVNRFIEAHEKSIIEHKKIININNKSIEAVSYEIIQFLINS